MRFAKWIGGGLLVLILGAALVFFGNFYHENSSNVSKSTKTSSSTTNSKITSKSGIQVTGKASDTEYKTVVKDGNYLVSKARGVTSSENTSNAFNTTSFENGLLEVAKNHFSPKSYIFQEGQYLSSATALNWLDRKSSTNSLGLNPTDNKKYDDSRAPIYLQTIEEQDFMTQDGNNLKLSGIVIGLAMNTQDSYQKVQYGATYTQDIAKADMIAHGKTIAAEVIKRYRAMKSVGKDVPIVVAMYAQAKNDSLSGGSFYAWAQSKSGDSLGTWNDINDATVVLPMQDGTTYAKAVATETNKSFVKFQDNIEGFFPNLSSVTAQAAFNGSTVKGMNVTVTTQFYSATEIQSFANYISQVAPNNLPTNEPVQIRVQTSTGLQALIVQQKNEKTYTVNIIGSY